MMLNIMFLLYSIDSIWSVSFIVAKFPVYFFEEKIYFFILLLRNTLIVWNFNRQIQKLHITITTLIHFECLLPRKVSKKSHINALYDTANTPNRCAYNIDIVSLDCVNCTCFLYFLCAMATPCRMQPLIRF